MAKVCCCLPFRPSPVTFGFVGAFTMLYTFLAMGLEAEILALILGRRIYQIEQEVLYTPFGLISLFLIMALTILSHGILAYGQSSKKARVVVLICKFVILLFLTAKAIAIFSCVCIITHSVELAMILLVFYGPVPLMCLYTEALLMHSICSSENSGDRPIAMTAV